jgi:hypothetical protein
VAGIVIETKTETLTTVPLEEFGPWLRRNNMIVVGVISKTWPPQLVCQPKTTERALRKDGTNCAELT